MNNKIEISVVMPAYKEGGVPVEAIGQVSEQLKKLKRSYEIILLDSDTDGNSEEYIQPLMQKDPSISIYVLPHPGIPVTDKSNKYTVGNLVAKGEYIIYMDVDGQDRPEELPKFVEKLDEGFDLVMGYKQDRKKGDGVFYVLTSRIANYLIRKLTNVDVHDMNSGFKGIRASKIRTVNLRGGNFRFLPAIFAARNYKVTEVPVKHVARKGGDGKFSFKSRLLGGMFDLPATVLVSKMGDTPIYMFGKFSIASFISFIAFGTWGILCLLKGSVLGYLLIGISTASLVSSCLIYMIGIAVEYLRVDRSRSLEDFEIVRKYPN